jgi:hypothetical protein
MADTARIRELVVGAGFAEPAIEEVSFRRQFVVQDAYWRFLIETSATTSPVLRFLQSEAQDTFRERVHEAARPFHSGEVRQPHEGIPHWPPRVRHQDRQACN